MSEEGNFWFRVWVLALVFFVTLFICVTFTMAGKRDRLAEMVGKGADPILAACALNMHDDKTLCVIYGVKEK